MNGYLKKLRDRWKDKVFRFAVRKALRIIRTGKGRSRQGNTKKASPAGGAFFVSGPCIVEEFKKSLSDIGIILLLALGTGVVLGCSPITAINDLQMGGYLLAGFSAVLLLINALFSKAT